MDSRPITPEEWAEIQRQQGGNTARWDYQMIPVDHDPFEWSSVPKAIGNALQNLSLSGMVKGAYGAAKNMMAYPKEVWDGKPQTTDDAVKWAADTAGLLGARGLAVPSEGLGVFAGKGAIGANRQGLQEAIVRGKGWAAPETVAEATGLPYRPGEWFRGSDGQWRYEIPDTHSAITPDRFMKNADKFQTYGKVPPSYVGTLGDFLDHPEAYAAYPWARDLPFEYRGDMTNNLGAYGQGRLALNNRISSIDQHSTTLHELQHAIQNFEGFANGSNPKNPAFVSAQYNHPQARELQTLNDGIRSAELRYGKAFSEHPLYKELMDKRTKLMSEVHGTAQNLYHRTAGETEARNVQSRWSLSTNQGPLAKAANTLRQMDPERYGTYNGPWGLYNGKTPHPLATLDVDPARMITLDPRTFEPLPLSSKYDIYGKAVK